MAITDAHRRLSVVGEPVKSSLGSTPLPAVRPKHRARASDVPNVKPRLPAPPRLTDFPAVRCGSEPRKASGRLVAELAASRLGRVAARARLACG